ncbi:MAG TPA: cation:proton antiporter [Vicinamibacterales bacterium]|nr:cation:proton antiporter [Vicinamibacterales bacterium]
MTPAGGTTDLFWHLLLALTAVVVVGRLLGALFRYIGQPPVIGEVVAGILLGPSLLGSVSPGAYAFLLPPSVAPSLGLLSQLGVVLYMFLVGIELDTDGLKGRLRSTVGISLTSIVVPFALGLWLASALYSRLAPDGVPFLHFAIFMGVAMSITAFPVLARILADRQLTRTDLGQLALSCAAVGDVTAWCLLAFVVGVVKSSEGNALLTFVVTVAFIAFLFVVVQPLVVKLSRRWEREDPDRNVIAFALVAMMCSALITEAIGVHAIFGAFLLGAVIPHDSRLARVLDQRIENLVTILLLPAFFAFAGMRTQIGLLSGWNEWITCVVIIVVATAGKFGGAVLGARVTGLDWRYATGLGVLMNTRGLMELIVLNVGLDLGVISPTLFTMLVIMALVTTMATTPALQWVFPGTAGGRASISPQRVG